MEATKLDDLVSVIDIASQFEKHKQTVFKVLKRLGITPTLIRNSSKKNQLVAYVTQDDVRRVSLELQAISRGIDGEQTPQEFADDFVSAEVGVFYLLLLEPELDPSRFKVGFAVSMPERLRQLRCSSPFATVVRTWPCRRRWEKTVIDSVSASCERLHTEVFRAPSIDDIVDRCEKLFALMPPA